MAREIASRDSIILKIIGNLGMIKCWDCQFSSTTHFLNLVNSWLFDQWWFALASFGVSCTGSRPSPIRCFLPVFIPQRVGRFVDRLLCGSIIDELRLFRLTNWWSSWVWRIKNEYTWKKFKKITNFLSPLCLKYQINKKNNYF